MNNSQLSEIYKRNNPNTDPPCWVLYELFEFLDKSPISITLAAKLADKDHYSVYSLLSILKNSEFNILKCGSKFNYNGSELNYLGHIRLIYKKYCDTMQKTERAMLEALSCFGNASIPRSLISQWINNVDGQWLQSMIDTGILSETTPDTIQMQRLAADAVFLAENPRYTSYKGFISKIHKYIKDFRYSFHQADIHDAFHEAASRLSHSVTTYNNPGQYAPSKEQEDWWEFVLDGIIYLLSSGRTECASHLLETLYVTTRGALQGHPYYVFKKVLNIHNDWINGCGFDQLVLSIGHLQKKYTRRDIQEYWQKPYQWLPSLTYFETIFVDFVHHTAMHSLMRSLLSQTASRTLSKNGVSLEFHLNNNSLLSHTLFFLQTSCLKEDERRYYLSICEYLGFGTFTPKTLFYLAREMYKNYQCCLLTSVRVKYICTLMLFFSACVLFNMADFIAAYPYRKFLQYFKELLDFKILYAATLTKMVSNLCITAYYYYAACMQSLSETASARKQIQRCCDKTPGLLKSEVDSLLKIFDETWKLGQS